MDEAIFRSAFWDDAVLCNGPLNGPIDEFLAWWLPSQSERESVQHSISNQSVEFDGDSAADVETYFLASVKKYGNPTIELLAARYVDRFVKRSGEWRIKSRVLLADWVATAEAAPSGSLAAARHHGSRSEADPSYARPVRPKVRRPTIQGVIV